MRLSPRWLQVAGWSGVGKTTILGELLERAKSRGERVFAVKFSDHSAIASRGDSGRLHQHGAEVSAMIGPDGVSWMGSLPLFAELLMAWEGDWVFVEGGRLLSTPKILLAQDQWPPYRPPVLARLSRHPAPLSPTPAFVLPEESQRAAHWLDLHRLACSAPAEQWIPLIKGALNL